MSLFNMYNGLLCGLSESDYQNVSKPCSVHIHYSSGNPRRGCYHSTVSPQLLVKKGQLAHLCTLSRKTPRRHSSRSAAPTQSHLLVVARFTILSELD